MFINHVKARRGAKLTDDPDVFSGLFWTGQAAKDLGWIDGIGHIVPILKAGFGDKVRFRSYNVKRNILQRFGALMIQDAVASVEERALYARFGM